MGQLWQAYSLVQKFKEIINLFGSVILSDTVRDIVNLGCGSFQLYFSLKKE